MEENKGKLGLFAGIDGLRFKEQVKPGDTLVLEVEMTRVRGSVGKGRGIARVNDKIAVEGELMFALVDAQQAHS
jgi:3-hydroxyacyl-[acyl-carrier-protein] dehydratase